MLTVNHESWAEAARRHLLPALPAGWQPAGPGVVSDGVDWLLRIVAPQSAASGTAFYMNWWVQLLAVPKDHFGFHLGTRLGQAARGAYWKEPADLAGYEPVMAEIAGFIRTEAAPMFDRYGTVDGYLGHLRERMAELAGRGGEWIDVNIDEELLYVSLLRGDMATAEQAAEFADRALAAEIAEDPDPPEWVVDAHARVQRVIQTARTDVDQAVEMLRENARFSAAAGNLPSPAV